MGVSRGQKLMILVSFSLSITHSRTIWWSERWASKLMVFMRFLKFLITSEWPEVGLKGPQGYDF